MSMRRSPHTARAGRRALPDIERRSARRLVMAWFQTLQDLPLEQVTESYARRALVGEKEMVVWASMKAGAHAAAHSHPHEQMFWMISGTMEFRLGDERRICRAG